MLEISISILIASSFILALIIGYSLFNIRANTKLLAYKNKLNLPVLSCITPNSFQCVLVYDSKSLSNVACAFSTTTLRKLPDLLSFIRSETGDFITFNLILEKKVPNFYIFSKFANFFHPGKELSKKYLLNKTPYGMFGCITDELYNFCKKYKVQYFFSSYLPENLFDKDLESSHVELRMHISDFKEGTGESFLECISGLNAEADTITQRIKKEFDLIRNRQKAFDNLGFFEKFKKELKAKRK